MPAPVRLAAAILVGLGLCVAPARAQAPAGTHTIFVSVSDKKGPVAGLTAADFTVKADGKPRDVTSVEPATSPLQIAVLIDDDDQGGQALRTALTAFARKMAGHGEIAIVSTRGGPKVRQDFSPTNDALLGAIGTLPLVNPGQAFLTTGLVDLSRALTERKAARPVIIAIASPGITVNVTEDGPDGPVPATKDVGVQPSPSSPALPLALDAIRRSHAIFYALHLDMYSARSVDNQPPVVHYSWPVDAPAQTGGRTDRLVTAQGIATALDRIADELLAQYAITFAGEVTGTPSLSVDLKKKGVTLRAPQRLY